MLVRCIQSVSLESISWASNSTIASLFTRSKLEIRTFQEISKFVDFSIGFLWADEVSKVQVVTLETSMSRSCNIRHAYHGSFSHHVLAADGN